LVSTWLSKAWDGITASTISNTWLKIFGFYEFDDDDDVYEQNLEADAGVIFVDNDEENDDDDASLHSDSGDVVDDILDDDDEDEDDLLAPVFRVDDELY
jgi:hypothetical protein